MLSKDAKVCCTPNRDQDAFRHADTPVSRSPKEVDIDKISIPGGRSLLGTNLPRIADDGEGPLRTRRIAGFDISATTITNMQFEIFVEETGYVTDAERLGWSFVFWSDVSPEAQNVERVPGVEWWRKVDGANWRDVTGARSQSTRSKLDHPVVQVSWNDAKAYADWAGGRLPTEAEWEHAARGGLGDVPFPWGDQEPDDMSNFRCNIWQGKFPQRNTGADGYLATGPARSFEPNGYGLYNTVGNVWEWTANPFKLSSLKKQVRQRMEMMRGFKVLKGGSFMCHRSYCHRYRIAARTGSSADSATTHQGFRVVWDTKDRAPYSD